MSEVVIVAGDPLLSRMGRSLGAVVIPDPGLGLNEAFLRGADRGDAVGVWTAMLMADLPCLTPDVVDRVLDAAAPYDSAVVPYRAGTGTTLLTPAPGQRPQPRFGETSFGRHLPTGAFFAAIDDPRARFDVDTPEDLGFALDVGVELRTAAAVGEFGLDRVGLVTQL